MSSSPSSSRARPRLAGIPSRAAANVAFAEGLLERGDGEGAMKALNALLTQAPDHPELLRLHALAWLRQGKPEQAIDDLRRARAQWPDDGLLMCQLGIALAQGGDLAGAERAFRDATVLDPMLADAWYNLGHALDVRTDTAGAALAFEQLLTIDPGHLRARVQYAEMLKMLGRLGDAESELRAVLMRDPDSISAWVGLSNLKTFTPDADDLERLRGLHASDKIPGARRVDFAFACASLLESAGRYPEAFALIAAANAGKRATIRWDAAAVTRLVDDILGQFGALSSAPAASRGREVIFLVGMPRSGSTLAEQILSTHPRVQGGGERNEIVETLLDESRRRGQGFPYWVSYADDSDWARLGVQYLDRCAAWRDTRASFTNKTLTNWQTLGAIRRMLPGAHVIHCQRDPLEMLWSAYKHHFGEAQFFSYDLDDLCAFWNDSERAMRFWSRSFPGWVHAHVFEDLIAQPDATIRALLDHCGLAFDPACMQFQNNRRDVRTSSASQVRQPLRRSELASDRYGATLDPIRQRIAALQRGIT